MRQLPLAEENSQEVSCQHPLTPGSLGSECCLEPWFHGRMEERRFYRRVCAKALLHRPVRSHPNPVHWTELMSCSPLSLYCKPLRHYTTWPHARGMSSGHHNLCSDSRLISSRCCLSASLIPPFLPGSHILWLLATCLKHALTSKT